MFNQHDKPRGHVLSSFLFAMERIRSRFYILCLDAVMLRVIKLKLKNIQ